MAEYVGTADAKQPIPDSELKGGYLYAVMVYRGDLASWNWAFFIPDPCILPIGTSGTVFHVVHETEGSKNFWKFVAEKKEVLAFPLVVAIVRLADVSFLGPYKDLIVSDDLLRMFQQVKVPASDSPKYPEFSSRTWFLDVITVLNECAVLTCNDTWNLEREIRRFAFSAMDKYLQNQANMVVLESSKCVDAREGTAVQLYTISSDSD